MRAFLLALTLLLVPMALAQGEVVAREFKGHDLTYRVRLHGVQPEREVLVQEGPTCPFKVGDRVGLEVEGEGVALEGTPPAPVRQEA